MSLSIVAVLFAACRTDEVLVDMEKIHVAEPEYTDVEGFYLLNEGNMGSNKSTLDYLTTERERITKIYILRETRRWLKNWAMWEMTC